jgi:hypothetical protein
VQALGDHGVGHTRGHQVDQLDLALAEAERSQAGPLPGGALAHDDGSGVLPLSR